MSEQRRLRAELKQGLHQFLMSLYHSYTRTTGHEVAIEQISEALEKEYKYFTKESLEKPSQSLNLEEVIKLVDSKARKERHAVKQHEYYEELEILTSAQDILVKYQASGDLQP